MTGFAKGFVCGVAVILFGKVMYDKGKRKAVKEERIGGFKITIEKLENEES